MSPHAMLRTTTIALALALVALGTVSCGKKGPPELPEGQTDQYPRQYPNPDEL